MNMRFWFEALAEPNKKAAHVLTTNPMKVRTLGLMRERASQRTMVSSRTPQARPKAEVHEVVIADSPWLLSSPPRTQRATEDPPITSSGTMLHVLPVALVEGQPSTLEPVWTRRHPRRGS